MTKDYYNNFRVIPVFHDDSSEIRGYEVQGKIPTGASTTKWIYVKGFYVTNLKVDPTTAKRMAVEYAKNKKEEQEKRLAEKEAVESNRRKIFMSEVTYV